MFENKGETSPPDRGRVPAALQPQASDPLGPLARVRTSFVTVEKGGRVGLQRDNSTDSGNSQARKLSGGSEGETVLSQTDATSTTAGDSVDSQAKPAVALWRANVQTPDEPMKPFPLRTPSPKAAKDSPAPVVASDPPQASTSVSAFAPAMKSLSNTSKYDAPKLSSEKTERVASRGKSPEKIAGKASELASVKATSSGTSSAVNVTKYAGASAKQPTAATPASAKTKTASSSKGKDASKPAATTATSPTKAKATKSVPKISTAAHSKPEKRAAAAPLKTPTSPSKSLALKHHKTPERKTPAPSEKTTPKSTTSSSSRSTASSSSKKPSAVHKLSPNGSAFVKPKPRSPTRPVQLPAGLVTHTAASATKANVTRQTQSRQAGSYDSTHQPSARASSRASIATVATTATKTTQRGLRRQNSTISRSRPSLGPPPKQPARDHSALKKEKDVDESFLARMMRPTQSSASKTADKSGAPHTSPPRKQSPAPVKRTARSEHSPVSRRPESAMHAMSLASTPPPSTPTPAESVSVTPKSTGSRATSSGKASPVEETSPIEKSSVTETVNTADVPKAVEQAQPEEAIRVATPEPELEPFPELVLEEEAEPVAADAVAQEQMTKVVGLAQPESDVTPEVSTPEEQEGKGAEVIEVTV
ncbi:hypothetical protein CMQ_3866 [Grosmannia clavigera kw1407]|uniref:Mucin-7 n=1 Tax=Grosmannia clavigera (strain kw1407 / UAMH 11150) TaxID=655863 RepID=F0XAG2_GROCL|nr:uncharacterized protein CMQ_3866 [Grosmannia clavigera kw1407]EFX05797.1 hypothetical protein CMQ_3866 [Grosmannia clavigera kw1407]